MSHHAAIALGSNIDPEKHLRLAVDHLRRLGAIAAVSRVYESSPADASVQANYLNAAVLLRTAISAETLCRESLPSIESLLGRVRDPQNKFAPRTIDLDLALFDTQCLAIDHHRIPDPEIADRAFLAIPLAEIWGDFELPQAGRRLDEIAALHLRTAALIPRPDVILPGGRV